MRIPKFVKEEKSTEEEKFGFTDPSEQLGTSSFEAAYESSRVIKQN